MSRYLHSLFECEAKRFYRTHGQNQCISYESSKSKMESEFNSITRQRRVRQYLQSLRLNKIREKESCEVTEGLEKLRDTITKFARQGPKSHRTDEAKS